MRRIRSCTAFSSNCEPVEEGTSSQINDYHVWHFRILTLLDDEPAPFESRDELLRKAREERLSRAAEKRNKYKEEFIAKQTVVLHDHRYSTSNDSEKLQPTENANGTITYNKLVTDLYADHVCLSH